MKIEILDLKFRFFKPLDCQLMPIWTKVVKNKMKLEPVDDQNEPEKLLNAKIFVKNRAIHSIIAFFLFQ